MTAAVFVCTAPYYVVMLRTEQILADEFGKTMTANAVAISIVFAMVSTGVLRRIWPFSKLKSSHMQWLAVVYS